MPLGLRWEIIAPRLDVSSATPVAIRLAMLRPLLMVKMVARRVFQQALILCEVRSES